MPKISTTHCSLASSTISLKTLTHQIQTPPSLTRVSLNQQVVVGQRKKKRRRGVSAMASTSAVSMAVPPAYAAQKKAVVPSSQTFFKPLPLRASKKVTASKPNSRFEVRASLKEKAVTGLTAAALTASLMVPDVAEAAVTPSLKNFLLSIVAGGVVVAAIVGAVIGVSNFDPVKRS